MAPSFTISRRDVLVSGALAAGILPVSIHDARTGGPQVILFDSRSTFSHRWASAKAGHSIDVAQAPVDLWKGLKAVSAGSVVDGLTSWSDFITIRSQLGEKGLRLKYVSRQGDAFGWSMR
jgi:hypothetical protein